MADAWYLSNTRTALGFTDADRTAKALKGIEGKRLTYRRIGSPEAASQP
jgi:hypothetical protein